MVDALEIGYAIKDRRAQLGLTQAQVADAAGVSKRCLWSLELGQNPGVQLDKLTAVLGALGLDLVLLGADCLDATGQRSGDPIGKSATTRRSAEKGTTDGVADALAILTGGRK